MKTLKRLLLYAGTALTALLGFSSCGGDVPVEEFAPYIEAYTGGLISQNSAIRIVLVDESAKANTEVEDELFSFSPSIKGHTYWVDNRTVEFVPGAGELRSGETYKATFKLGEVMEVERRFRKFKFEFRVEDKNFAINVNPVEIPDPAKATVSGSIIFSEDIALETVQKAFIATTSDKQTLAPQVMAGEDGKTFRFAIENIQRKKEMVYLEIKLDNKVTGTENDGLTRIIIPELDVFKVLSAEIINEPSPGIQIVFSDPLNDKQDLRGLIRLPEISSINIQQKNNIVNLFFDRKGLNALTLTVEKNVKNTKNETLQEKFTKRIRFEAMKPQVELLTQGSILPSAANMKVPFRAVSLKAVDVKVIRIYESNVLSFLQENRYSGHSELKRYGRLIYKKTLKLDSNAENNVYNWQNYSIDLSKAVEQEKGAIYRIEFSFKPDYSVYPCDGKAPEEMAAAETSTTKTEALSEEISDSDNAYWDNAGYYYYSDDNDYYDWGDYDWEERDNPCNATYYMRSERKVSCNVLATDLGIIAKIDPNNKLWVAVSSISDAKPLSGAKVTAYNLQLQTVATGQTDGDGFAMLAPKGKTFIVVAELNGQKTYLRVVDGEDNSLSRFDTGGKTVEKGLKGFIYGERGVWRPGDTLHLAFILYDKENRIPENHPVTLELYNPQGQFSAKRILTKGVNGFYVFHIPTSQDDETGLWNAYVKLGGVSFHKSVRIETIKPNRLKINLSLPEDRIDAGKTIQTTLTSAWLTGLTARNLDVKVEMTLNRANTAFKGYDKYLFNNPATDFYSSTQQVFGGKLDSEGKAVFNLKTPPAKDAPGLLNASIVCRVFEEGGDASIYTQDVKYSPFSSYVGLNTNQPEGKWIETDTEHRFDIVTLDAEGKPVNRDNIEYKIYSIGWSWWWENASESFANYVNSSSYTPVARGTLKTVNGKANFKFRLNYPGWGRFFVYVIDRSSGHATGSTVYIDWATERGRSNRNDPNNAKMLSFSTDKTSYETGETVTVSIPASAGGNALVALENGTTILSRAWVPVQKGADTKYTFKVTEEMAPNFYIHISLLQPYGQTVNDLPIRMYGVMPVLVNNRSTHLEPVIDMPEKLQPETEFTVKVSEKGGNAMTYTLAIVDEGLLDLTNFKTPDAWKEFYAREALGIRTWDMFDEVMGAFSGKYASMFSIGGDEAVKEGSKANRFKPVVKYVGVFSLGGGDKNTHKIRLPQYVGSVRTMVVAGGSTSLTQRAYGKAEKTTPVITPLMLLSSLPRVLSTEEEITLPVNVFAMENDVKKVSVKVETTGLLTADENTQTVSFDKPSDRMVFFKMKTGAKTGIEKVTITATGGGKTAREIIEIDVRNPNPAVIISDNRELNAGQTFTSPLPPSTRGGSLTAAGATPARTTPSPVERGQGGEVLWAKMELSRIPSVDITKRFDFLYDYNHYCSEQLTSRALPLLYIPQFKDVSKEEKENIDKNVREAIKNLYGRQMSNGGIVYWQGQTEVSEWITNYAGSFLVLAKEKGYEVNEGVLTRWKNYQKKAAQNWTAGDTRNYYSFDSEYTQAYRLYTLALAGAAEIGAMNRMKEMKSLSLQSRWRLAAAYSISGKQKAAEELIFNQPSSVSAYYGGYTYGSSERDEAMILETLVLMGKMTDAFKQAQTVATSLARENSFSTQSTAYALAAMGALAEKTSGEINAEWTLNGKAQTAVNSKKALYVQDLRFATSDLRQATSDARQSQVANRTSQIQQATSDARQSQVANRTSQIQVTNKGKGVLYVNVLSKIRPQRDSLPAVSNNLRLDVQYTTLDGKPIAIDKLPQGTDFVAIVKVSNTSATSNYTDIALTHIIPAGWEIFSAADGSYTHQDVRDDRVLTYFDLAHGRAEIFKVRLTATYTGKFTLPAVQAEAMYDPTANARTRAGRVEVMR
ncbi:hypothetical protein FACS189434_12470 [Bacteroidia bacterium]|nr:hypothetical protein FACS189434_12470 [Bacteroidia bacterium]